MHGHGWFRPYQGHPAPVFKGAFCLSPQGRGATDYRDLGEIDVLSALEDVQRDFNIDPERIYLKGGSMGGTGAWNLGVHYADRFAGIMPIAGNADNRAWTSRWEWNEPFEGRFDQLRDAIQQAHTSRAFARNLINLPAYIVHGSGDTVVPPEHARFMVAEMQRFNCTFEYREFPNVGHGGFNNLLMDEGLAWVCGHRRRPYPEHILWTTAQMRHSTCYWLRIEQMKEPLEFASIDAQLLPNNRLAVTTENIRAFSIWTGPEVISPEKPVFVTVNDDRVIFPPQGNAPARWTTLRQDEQTGWDNEKHMTKPELIKTRGRDGPIHEAILDPFVLVIGTMSFDPAITDLWHLEARRFANEWKRRNGAPCPFVTDVQVTPEMAESRNLICFGGPGQNSVATILEDALPTDRILADAAILADTAHTDSDEWAFHNAPSLDAPDIGYMTVYPNPEAPNRLVVVIHGNGPEAIYQAWQRFGNWFNWGVYDSKKYFDYAVYDARSASPETMLLLGYFGTDWQIDSGRQFPGVRQLRQQMAPQLFPAYDTVPEDAAVFDLVNLRPVMIDQMRGAIGFGRTFQGLPLPLGIGVRAPTFIEYELDGNVERLIAGGMLINSPETGMPSHRESGEKVRFIVKGDKTVLASAVCSWDSPVAQMEADLNGVKRLRLEAVTAGGPAWLHAGAAWLAPRLYRP
jgi:predicted esterase